MIGCSASGTLRSPPFCDPAKEHLERPVVVGSGGGPVASEQVGDETLDVFRRIASTLVRHPGALEEVCEQSAPRCVVVVCCISFPLCSSAPCVRAGTL